MCIRGLRAEPVQEVRRLVGKHLRLIEPGWQRLQRSDDCSLRKLPNASHGAETMFVSEQTTPQGR